MNGINQGPGNKKQNKPAKKILVDSEQVQNLQEFTSMLETLTSRLKEQGSFTITQGTEAVQVQPADQVEVEIKYEIKGDKHSFELELEWYEGQKGGTVSIS